MGAILLISRRAREIDARCFSHAAGVEGRPVADTITLSESSFQKAKAPMSQTFAAAETPLARDAALVVYRALSDVAAKGSLFLTRPSLVTYTAKREDLVKTANDLFDVVKSGAVKINVNQTFPLKNAAESHRAPEGRKTTGSAVLLP